MAIKQLNSDDILAKLNLPDADFWLQRKAQRSNVGKTVKEFNKENIGIKVISTHLVDPKFLSYWFDNIYNQGYWRTHANPSTRGDYGLTVRDVRQLINKLSVQT